jgi:predicted transcriptional regulator
MIHSNSKAAYASVQETTGARRIQVLKVIRELGPITRQDIGEELGLAINSITGRVTELLSKGVICVDGQKYSNNVPRGLLRVV